jgi:hypothetical protein
MKEEFRPGDFVKYDIVIGKNTVKGQGRITALRKGGAPMIQPSSPLPAGAKLENITKA